MLKFYFILIFFLVLFSFQTFTENPYSSNIQKIKNIININQKKKISPSTNIIIPEVNTKLTNLHIKPKQEVINSVKISIEKATLSAPKIKYRMYRATLTKRKFPSKTTKTNISSNRKFSNKTTKTGLNSKPILTKRELRKSRNK